MKPRHFRTWAAFALLLLLPLGWAGQARGCGLDWALPRNHFEGVTNQGNVSWWEKIGEVDCGDGLVLPLHINFNSHRDGGAPSPYLGEGWILPLLESKFVQEGEDRFNMIQPDGLNNLFLRAEAGGSVLNGSSGWKGEIKGDTITAWASCGWKLTFENGHITSMTTAKGRRLDWVYEGGKVSELREGSATRLKVEYGSDGKVQALALPGGGSGGGRILVAQDKKPRVQTVAGQNVVTGVDSSLSHLTLADGRAQSFTFGTDEKMQPTLEIGNVGETGETGGVVDAVGTGVAFVPARRQIVWDPQSKIIAKDGEWSYQISPAKYDGGNAAIGRTNVQGQKEYWFYDGPNGKEIIGASDGTEITKTWFTSSTFLIDKPKSKEITFKGKKIDTYKYSYDVFGKIIRAIHNDEITTYEYGQTGYSSTTSKNDLVLNKKIFNQKDQLLEEILPNKQRAEFKYLPDGSKWKTIIDDISTVMIYYDATGELRSYSSSLTNE